MTEEENAEQTQEQQTPVQQQQEEQQPAAVDTPKEDVQDRNWKEARASIKELAEKNKLLEDALVKIQQPPPQQETDEIETLSDDDIITKKQLMQFGSKIRKKAKEEAFGEFYNKTAEDRLESKCPDFKTVCSHENIATLKSKFPELAASLASSPDVYAQGKAVYDLITSLGIHSSEANANRKKMAQNAEKPQMGGIAKTAPLDTAHLFESGQRPVLNDSLKKSLLDEMNAAIKGH